MKIKACESINEYISGIALINNVFRIADGYDPTMQDEFPYLLSEDNMDRMFIAKQKDRTKSKFARKAVSVASYLKNPMLIEGIEIMTASIGAVCTYEEYRGRELSSQVLDLLEENMKDDGVDICFVSGTRSLYTRRNFIEALSMEKYSIPVEENDLNEMGMELKDYKEAYLKDMLELYEQNPTRYVRTYDEFKTNIISRPFKWGILDYITKVIFRNGKITAYVIVQTIDKKDGVIIEAAGNKEDYIAAAQNIAFERNLETLIYEVHEKDTENKLENCEAELVPNRGTMKVVDYSSLMKKLKLYFIKNSEFGKSVKFSESDDKYSIEIDEEKITVEGVADMSRLVLGKLDTEEFKSELESKKKIAEFVEKCFPIPLPFTENLNYQ